MAGWSATEITQGLEGVLNLATAGCIDLGQASDFVTDGLEALGMSASQSNDFVDMLSATITKSNTGVSQMQGAFTNVAPIAGTLGVSMSDLSTSLGLMANSGVKAEKAGTALKALLTNMSSPTESMTKAIQKYNLEGAQKLITDGKLVEGIKEMKTQLEGLTASEKTSVITTIAGREALSGVSALLNSSTNDINSLKFAVDSSTKSSRAYAQSLGLIDKEGNIVAGTFDNMVKTQGKAYEQWQNFNSVMEECADTATFVGAGMTDLGAITAKLGEDGKVTAEQVNDVLDVFDKLQDTSKKTTDTLKKYGIEIARNDDNSINFGKTLKNLGGVWDNLSDAEKKALAEQLGFKGSIEELNELFGDNGDKIEDLVDSYEKAQGVSEHLAESFDATLKGSILSLSSAIQERLLQVFDKIKPAVQGVIDTLTTFFDIWNGMSEKIEGSGFGKAIEWLEEQSRNWGKAIANGLSNAIKSIDEFVNGNSFNAILQIGTNIIQGICDGILKAKENGSLDSAIDGVIKKICKWIELNAPKVGKAGKTIIDSIRQGIENNKDNINGALDTVMGVLQTWAESSSELKSTCNTFAGKFIDFAVEGIKTKAGELSRQIPIIIGQALVKVATGQYIGQLLEIGANIVLGICQGIGQGIGDLISSLIELGNTIINEIKGALGIHSPSTVMAEVGSNIIAGLVEGLVNGIGDITEAIGKVIDAIKDGFKDIWDKIFGKDDNDKELLNIDTTKIEENKKALNSLGETATKVQGQVREAFVGMANICRNQIVNCTNIIRNQAVNWSNIIRNQCVNCANIFRNQFVSMSNVARNQMISVSNIVRNQAISWSNVIRNQCQNARNSFTQQFMSMRSVARNQLVAISNIVRNQAVAWANIIRNQSANCRSAMTSNFNGLASVARAGMSNVLATVRSYMAQIRSAVSQQMTMNFKVNKTVTTTNVTKNVQEGMRSTMSAMNSNMMGVGSPNIMSASGLGTININTNNGGISGNLALEVPLYLDGREVARATASYTQDELAKLSKRKNRKRGE